MSWLFPRGRTSFERFQIAVQRTRVLAYVISGLVGGLFVLADVLPVAWPMVGVLVGVSFVTAYLFVRLVMWGVADRMGRLYDALWLTVDAFFITWGVHATGGFSSPWFIWYLANISGAAFVVGQRGASAVAALDCMAYLGLLALRGEMGWFDDEMYLAVARMTFMYASSFLFFRGASLLRRKRDQVETLRTEEARKLADLTRLTAALDQRTRELEVANLRIREADRLKSQFLATMSHELRTPLNSIIGFSEILDTKMGGELPERYSRFLRNINLSGRHLLKIINNILDLSKIEAGRMEMAVEAIDLPAAVEGVLSVMLPTARERRIIIATEYETDVTRIEVDPVKLKQVLFNLLSNAVKYSPDEGEVSVRIRDLSRGRTEEEAIEIAITDHGIGIDPVNHRLIFDEFRQVDGSATRSHGGTGLGLALVRRLVSLHLGTVEVDSALGRGATFTVTLPTSYSGDEELRLEPLPGGPDSGGRGGSRILVVEDDPASYEILAGHLSSAGYLPVRARTGTEAVDLARRLKPAAITLDVILPEIDGWETLRRLKADETVSDVPVVMVSMLRNRELGLALGAADYFTKPVDGDALVRRLTELVPASRARVGRLLLVDDDPDLHQLVTERLALQGYELFHAMSGVQGLEMAYAHLPDLVLLDLMMEAMDGFEVAARLKDDRRTRLIPIVVLTAKEMTRADRERLRGKIEALVEKMDMSSERLAEVIGGVLGAHFGGGDHERT